MLVFIGFMGLMGFIRFIVLGSLGCRLFRAYEFGCVGPP